MLKAVPSLLAVLALGCASSAPSRVAAGTPTPTTTVSPTASASGQRAANTPPARGAGEGRDFPAVTDRGLVTIQDMSRTAPQVETLRVAMDGAWSFASSSATKTGQLEEKQLAAVRALITEATSAKPSELPEVMCEAVPTTDTRILTGENTEVAWSSPCGGLPPSEAYGVLRTYLDQVVQGRPASDLEATLRAPRRR